MLLNAIFSVVIGLVLLIILNTLLDLRLLSDLKNLFTYIIDAIANHNTKKYLERIKRNKIVKTNDNIISKYNRVVENIIFDYNLPLTLEGFNSFISILFAILVLVIVLFLKDVTLSALVAVSLLVGAVTYFTMRSRNIKAAKIESIMDAEDLICPLARDGVLVAIKKVLESDEYINADIRPFFIQFVENCENYGYSFKRAMEILNRQLGPKFDNFAKKAVIFEYNERKGMADIFLDIVEENAALREINARKNRIFKKMNMNFIMKTALIVIFVAYSMTISELRSFLLESTPGRFILTLTIVSICLSFARCQALQTDIGSFGGENKW
ncbi:hypothetical protein [Acetivibrio straminisolvens]|jgi:ABC-type multidrug transport system fused ATPase/permease subunit|uniref:Flp pilus assembly protein TadB n=1 Tax=Acetivibrio straminisolvens JCM 21531 TaxID=1294263 RepID=W4V145_9FIRM|nr:hypothetical protein [Acetivibrio straminisolvens]GAE86926.1 hypothetical protein JCM21531_259 [Acetivibrio straminisolvens JCM 21531]